MSRQQSRITGDDRSPVRMTCTVDPVHHLYPLEERARMEERSVSYYVRKAIEEYLERHPMEELT